MAYYLPVSPTVPYSASISSCYLNQSSISPKLIKHKAMKDWFKVFLTTAKHASLYGRPQL